MIASPLPYGQDLVLVGGGHSHALALRMLGMRPLPGVRITLVSDVSSAPYSGMLPGHVAGFYSWEEMHIDLRRLCAFAGAAFVLGRVEGLDPAGRAIHVEGRPPLHADVVSLNVGSNPSLSGVPGAETWAIPAKPVPRLLEAWERVKAAAAERPRRLVLAGGGAGGVELALNMQHALGSRASITLLHQGPRLLPGHNERVRRILARLLAERGVTVRTGTQVTEVTADGVQTAAGGFVPADFVFWVTHAAAPPWVAESGLATTADGFIRVTPELQAIGHPWIFAAGDVATIEGDARPKSGVFAVRMARPLVANLRAWTAGRPLASYRPQRQFLSLIGTGDGQAVASRRWLAGRSALFWTLKDRIDRRFMQKFEDLPAMAEPEPAAGDPETGDGLADLERSAHMRCLGCAAKVAGATLTRVMDRLRAEHGPAWRDAVRAGTVLVGLDAPDDAAAFTVPPGQALVQTVDYMPSLVSDPYLFGRIAAIHSLSDLFAMGAAPHSVLAAALVPFAAGPVIEETLYQMLAGVLRELAAAGAVLIGGHSAEGSVPGLALTCNGLVDPTRLLRKSGLRAGDALLLTKPLGIGVLFAAHMRLEAKAAWIDAALEAMLVSNQAAAAILRDHGAGACTDVTGFGLAGHLLEMLRPAGLGATIDLAAVSALPGALDCLRRGLASSLSTANRRALAAVANAAGFAADERLALLFDPQTSGGLLAGVPAERAANCVELLRAAGSPHAVRIGTITRPAQGGAISLTDGG
jgi:selenide, water dikinase